MRNTIRFYYRFDDIHVTKINNMNLVKYKNKMYIFAEIFNQENIIEAHALTHNYMEYEKIVLNKDRSIFTPYNGKIYVLIERYPVSNLFPPIRPVLSNINYLLDRSDWGLLWSNKIDYYEYQFKHIKGNYKSIDESIDYFIGMTESAISYVNYNVSKSIKQKVLCRRRMIPGEYYNPLNIVIDYRMRDVGEYIKNLFWTGNYDLDKIKTILSKIDYFNENSKLLYARLLYPSYYFDSYEKVINNKDDELIIKKIISRIDEYEEYVNTIFDIIHSYDKNLIKIDWL